MNIGEIIKINTWWKLVLICGILLSSAAFIFDVQFIDRRYVFGLGLGMLLIGIGYWMALKYAHEFTAQGVYSWDVYQHNLATKILIGLGSVMSLYFLVRIILLLL